MKKNDLLTGIVDSIGYNGEGILHIDGTTVFVPLVLVGEEISFKVLKVRGNIAFGKVIEVLSPSKARVTPRCKVFGKCGGCQLQHADYKEQLKIKTDTVVGCFKKIAGIDVSVDNVFYGEDIYGYRNKLQLPVRRAKDGVKVGFFRENSHDIVETDCCPIQPDWATDVIKCVKDFIAESGVSCYDESTGKGLLRHVVVRELVGEFIFTLVVNGNQMKGVNRLIDRLIEKFGTISVYLNINESDSNVILGDEFKLLYGSGKIELSEFGVRYSVGAQSFMQVNTKVKQKLYGGVLNSCDIDENTVVIDGYSGAGVLTAMLAKKAKKAYGVEIIQEAVDSAEKLAVDNGLRDTMQSICAPCEDVLPSLIGRVKTEGDKTVLVLDPPRKGVDIKVLLAALDSMPDEIIYVSCSPQSLARDVGVLTGRLKYENNALTRIYGDFCEKYEIKSVNCYDLFPQTKHVETVVLMSRVKE